LSKAKNGNEDPSPDNNLLYFVIEKQLYIQMKEMMEKGDDHAKQWIETFHKLGAQFYVKIRS